MQWRTTIPKNAPHWARSQQCRGGWLRSAVRVGIAALAAAVLAGCSKTASWEEEVPLNTGATIWVQRSVKYTLQGESGNPMKIAYRPVDDESISFAWNGKKYKYYGDACIQLLAIDPRNRPVLVAHAGCRNWEWKHHYSKCARYVQLVPNEKGNVWSWPPDIDPWVYGLRSNLMVELSYPNRLKNRVSRRDRESLEGSDAQTGFLNWVLKPTPSEAASVKCK